MSQIIAGILLIQDNEYVIQKRDNIPNIAEPGMLALWGGAAENEETPSQAGVRELQEETGLEVEESDLTFIANYETHGRSPEFIGKTINVYMYVLKVAHGVAINCYEGEKLVRYTSLRDAIAAGEKPTEFLEKAIELYEQTAA